MRRKGGLIKETGRGFGDVYNEPRGPRLPIRKRRKGERAGDKGNNRYKRDKGLTVFLLLGAHSMIGSS